MPDEITAPAAADATGQAGGTTGPTADAAAASATAAAEATPSATAAAATPDDDPRKRREERMRSFVEIGATILLGLAAILTAWSAYQAVVHSGASLEAFSQSSLKAVEAQKNLGSGDLYWTEDVIVFLEYQKALRSGDTEFADYLKGLMSPNLVEGIDWWQAQPSPRPASPFVEGSPEWTNEFYDRQVVLEREAAIAFAQAQEDGAIGDQFTLATVLYAVVLFFAGIATAVRRPAVAATALGFGAVVFVIASVHLVSTQLH